ncbi:hypothetical protein KDK_51650 [Dictyobacter kobayashii]|uniref:Uncharacterized protein n=1 Tax=Dictyobacter kobayashii TaxID=2014872 RepID=A0A402AQM9_9CHLR|nr:hypothetical protein KDK_51650 [Dictyobacter kobayashii]
MRIFNLAFNIALACMLGMLIVVILNFFNRSGPFALLSGLFGTLLYCAVSLPRLLFGPRSLFQRDRRYAGPPPTTDDAQTVPREMRQWRNGARHVG